MTLNILYEILILHAAFLLRKGFVKKAYKVIESAWVKKVWNKQILEKNDIDHHIEQRGFIKHRSDLFEIFKVIPQATGELGSWIDAAKQQLAQFRIGLNCIQEAREMQIETLFSLAEAELEILNYTAGTVHSVKGETFDAVLLFLKTKGIGKNYTTMINDGALSDQEEELRIIYVGITRPRILLMIAVPNDKNLSAWKKLLSQ